MSGARASGVRASAECAGRGTEQFMAKGRGRADEFQQQSTEVEDTCSIRGEEMGAGWSLETGAVVGMGAGEAGKVSILF